VSTSTLSPPDGQLETLADQLISYVARTQNSGQSRGLYGEFHLVVSLQDGQLNDYYLDGRRRFRTNKKK